MSDDNPAKLIELSRYFIIVQDQNYLSFCKSNKSEIFSVLKNITDSIIIEEIDDDVLIKYLLENEDIKNSNESSVSRIETLHGFLPFYGKYRAEAIILPFPNLDMYEFVLQNAEKAMPPENIRNFFEIHLNQIWRKTIVDKYRASSAFEWQQQMLKKRLKALDFVKTCTRYFEAVIEKNPSRIKSVSEPLIQSSSSFIEFSKLQKTYPEYKRTSIIASLTVELKKMDGWSSAITIFTNQFVWLIKPPSDNSRNVAFRNFESALYELSKMQEGFDVVLKLTTRYVSTDQINRDELEWYRRLFNSLQYFLEIFIPYGNSVSIKNAKDSLVKWIEDRDFKRINQLQSIIDLAESHLIFHQPNRLIQEYKSLHAIIGVDYLEQLNDSALLEMFFQLRNFAETDIDWFTFVTVKNGRALGAFKCHRNYFERIKESVETNTEFDQGSYGNPMPVELSKVPIEVLEDIFFEPFEGQQETDAFVNMMYDVWRLQQYRANLNSQSQYEQLLLDKKEALLTSNIKSYLQTLSVKLCEEKYKSLRQTITDFVKNIKEISQEEILSKLNKWTEEMNI
jgi:hypothetical protein